MGRKRSRQGYQWVRDDQEDTAIDPVIRETHRETREADAHIASIAEQLLQRTPAARKPLMLPPVLIGALEEHKRLSGGARNRNMRRLKSLIRGLDDLEALEAGLAEETPSERRARELERWRTRLIEGSDADLQAFVDAHPTADRTAIRNLCRACRKEDEKALRASKALFQLLKTASPLPGPAAALPEHPAD